MGCRIGVVAFETPIDEAFCAPRGLAEVAAGGGLLGAVGGSGRDAEGMGGCGVGRVLGRSVGTSNVQITVLLAVADLFGVDRVVDVADLLATMALVKTTLGLVRLVLLRLPRVGLGAWGAGRLLA